MTDIRSIADLYSSDRPNLAQAPTAANAAAVNSYNTPLPPDQEAAFQAWAQKMWGPGSGDSRQLSDVVKNYDMRGYFASGATQGDNGHFPDTFKKPNHPTFSDESKYSSQEGGTGGPGGQWVQDPNTKEWTSFEATPTNLQHHSLAELQRYFAEVEPDTAFHPLGSGVAFQQPGTLADMFLPKVQSR